MKYGSSDDQVVVGLQTRIKEAKQLGIDDTVIQDMKLALDSYYLAADVLNLKRRLIASRILSVIATTIPEAYPIAKEVLWDNFVKRYFQTNRRISWVAVVGPLNDPKVIVANENEYTELSHEEWHQLSANNGGLLVFVYRRTDRF